MEAVAIGLVDPHDANFAFDGEHPSRRLGTMRRHVESTVDKFPWGEHSLRAAVEPITAYVLGLSCQKNRSVPSLELNGPMHASPVAPAAIPLG
jgi:hypothetical protein